MLLSDLALVVAMIGRRSVDAGMKMLASGLRWWVRRGRGRGADGCDRVGNNLIGVDDVVEDVDDDDDDGGDDDGGGCWR